MDTVTVPFTYTGTALLNGSGYGTVLITPGSETDWTINAISVSASTQSLEAQVRVYRGLIGPAYMVSSTFMGSSGDTDDSQLTVNRGEVIWVEFTGGDPGATGVVLIRGFRSQDVAGFVAR